jgi:hypothetical protein
MVSVDIEFIACHVIPIPLRKGVMYNGDEESPGQEGEEDHQKEITDAWFWKHIRNTHVQLYHEAGLRGFVLTV